MLGRALLSSTSTVGAVRLESHDDPENRKYPLQNHEGRRAGTR